jgi:hypothetical protein
MPHNAIKFVPGVDQNRTPALNEMAISECQLVRFVPDKQGMGLVQKLGGWQKYFGDAIGSPVRALHAWEGINLDQHLGVGAESSLSVITNGNENTITPQKILRNEPVNFSTTAGSNLVTVTDTGSNTDQYDSVYIQTDVSVGGLILRGVYKIYPLGPNTYNIYATNTLGDPALATTTVANGGIVSELAATAGSAVITITLPDHGKQVGDTATFLVATSIGGLSIYGNYTVQTVLSSSQYTILAANQANATVITVTGASGTGTTATLTFSSAYEIAIGTNIVVAGVTPAGYNGTHTVTVTGTNTVSFASAETGAFVSGGTITAPSVSTFINGGEVRFLYYNGLGPLPQGTGYGIGPYGAGGYGTGIPPIPNTGTPITTTDWTLDNWGETFIANPADDAIYTWTPSQNDPVAIVIPNAPPVNRGLFVAMPQRQIIAYGSTFTGIQDPLLIRWCDVDNYDSWIGLVTNQAGSYRIPKGSRIVGAIQGPQQGLLWTDLALWAMQYVGGELVYGFNEISAGCGLIAKKAAGLLNNQVYWMSQSQFFRLTGTGVEPIFCPVWDVIFQDLDTNNLDKIRCAPNSRFNEVTWYYPTIGNGGEVSHYVKYNAGLNCWDFGTLGRTAWINQSVLGPPIGAGVDQYIYQHEVGQNDDVRPMTSWFQTGYMQLSEADVKMFIDQVWPDMKWGYYNGVQNVTLSLSFYVVDYPGETPTVYGPFLLTQQTTFVTPRFRGRLVSIRMESNDFNTFWRIGNMRYRFQVDGRF